MTVKKVHSFYPHLCDYPRKNTWVAAHDVAVHVRQHHRNSGLEGKTPHLALQDYGKDPLFSVPNA
jgi:hypothetical protein